MPAEVVYLYDLKFWRDMLPAWQQGFAAHCPKLVGGISDERGSDEWRASAKRLAKRLGCTVRTYPPTRIVAAKALANDGYPLGIVAADDRRMYDQHRAEADGS